MKRSRYRVHELAAEAGTSVALVRSYQARGLLPAPAHEGRLAWYGPHHVERLRRIAELKGRGWSLRAIDEQLSGHADGVRRSGLMDRDALSERTGVPVPVLRSLESSGVLRPRTDERGHHVFTDADEQAVHALLSLLSSGMPIEEFMEVADEQLATARKVADETLVLFLTYIRQPLLDRGVPSRQEADRLVAALRRLLGDTATLLAYNFQRMLLEAASRFVEAEGTRAEQAALRRALRDRFGVVSIPESG